MLAVEECSLSLCVSVLPITENETISFTYLPELLNKRRCVEVAVHRKKASMIRK